MGILQTHQSEWDGAACHSPSPQDIMKYGDDLMFPKGEGGKKTRQENYVIRTYCRQCPLIAKCAEVGKNEEFGVWGGKGESSRGEFRAFMRLFAA